MADEEQLPQEEPGRPELSMLQGDITLREAMRRAAGNLILAEVGIGNKVQADTYVNLAETWLSIAQMLVAVDGDLDQAPNFPDDGEDA